MEISISPYEKYEYKFAYINSNKNKEEINKQLNELGYEGWELINFIQAPNTDYFKCIFKRRKLN